VTGVLRVALLVVLVAGAIAFWGLLLWAQMFPAMP